MADFLGGNHDDDYAVDNYGYNKGEDHGEVEGELRISRNIHICIQVVPLRRVILSNDK